MTCQEEVDVVEVALEQTVYSTVPGRVGNWNITRRVTLPAVPRAGDWVEPANGWGLEPVRGTSFLADGPPVVALQPVATDDPARLEELDRLVTEHGWTQLGGPWRQQ